MAHSNTRNFNTTSNFDRRNKTQTIGDVMEIKQKGKNNKKKSFTSTFNESKEKEQEKEKDILTIDQQLINFYTISLKKFGFNTSESNIIINSFFEKKNEDKPEETEETENDDDILKEQVSKFKKNDKKEKTDKKEKKVDISRDEITHACILLLIDINKWFYKNKDNVNEMSLEIEHNIKEFRNSLADFPNMFSIPKDSGLPNHFIEIFSNLGLVPQHFNLTIDNLSTFLQLHIEGIKLQGCETIKFNQEFVNLASDPSKRPIALSHNKLLNNTQRKQMLTSFIIGCSMVSKPLYKIDFLPAKFIDVIADVYPTIGGCVKAINSKKDKKPIDNFNEWSKSELGKTLLCGEEYQPSEETLKNVFSLSWSIYTALYNTMTNRNCFSKNHTGIDSDGKKIIFPFMPVDFIKHISHTFPTDLFKSTVDEMSNHKFISASFMMSMIISLLVVSLTNPNNDINKYYKWIKEATEDYHKYITVIKGETKEEKHQRVMEANNALYDVIKYMDKIGEQSNIGSLLDDNEAGAFTTFFDSIFNLFPDNKPTEKKSEHKNTKVNDNAKPAAKGTDQYYMSFPDIEITPKQKPISEQNKSDDLKVKENPVKNAWKTEITTEDE